MADRRVSLDADPVTVTLPPRERTSSRPSAMLAAPIVTLPPVRNNSLAETRTSPWATSRLDRVTSPPRASIWWRRPPVSVRAAVMSPVPDCVRLAVARSWVSAPAVAVTSIDPPWDWICRRPPVSIVEALVIEPPR